MNVTPIDTSAPTLAQQDYFREHGTLPRKPTAAERKAEIRKLESLLQSSQPVFTDYWSHLRACVELQLKVLRDPNIDLRPYDLDEGNGWTPLTQDILDRAMDAGDWLRGDGLPSLSAGWRDMLSNLLLTLDAA